MGVERLKQARDHLLKWLDRSEAVASAAPQARKLADQLDWEVRTLENRPPEAANFSTASIDQHSEGVLRRVTTSFPMLPPVDLAAITQVNSITTSTTSATVTFVTEIGRIGTPAATAYASKALTEYRALQDTQRRPDEVRRLLERNFPSLLPRFDAARSAYEKARARHGDNTGAAIAMRNLIDGIKGELFERARRHSTENMTIDIVIQCLFATSPTVTEVAEEFQKRSNLISDLSAIAKARETASAYELDGLWSRVLDHAVIILSAVP
jgi:hypothetical protein